MKRSISPYMSPSASMLPPPPEADGDDDVDYPVVTVFASSSSGVMLGPSKSSLEVMVEPSSSPREVNVEPFSSSPEGIEVLSKPSTSEIHGSDDFDELLASQPVQLYFDSDERNIWDMAVKNARIEHDILDTYHSTLIVVGSKSAGKSTMIKQFLGKSDPVDRTYGVDFNIAKPPVDLNLPTRASHIYEVGGAAAEYPEMTGVAITYCRYPDKLTLIMVLDLTQPAYIYDTVETVLENARKAYMKLLDELAVDGITRPLRRLRNRLDELYCTKTREGPGKRDEEAFPLAVGIIGAKYDKFKEYPLELKEAICSCIRLIALKLGAAVCFYDNQEIVMKQRIRAFLNYYAFGTPFPLGVNPDPEKPLLVPETSDCLRAILNNPKASAQYCCTWAFIRDEVEKGLKIKCSVYKSLTDPGRDPRFADSHIDRRRDEAMVDIEFTAAARRARDAASDDNFFDDWRRDYPSPEPSMEVLTLFKKK